MPKDFGITYEVKKRCGDGRIIDFEGLESEILEW